MRMVAARLGFEKAMVGTGRATPRPDCMCTWWLLGLALKKPRVGTSLAGQTLTGRRESGQIPIRLLYCILSSRVPNEVDVNINWDTFCKGRSSVFLNSMPKKASARLHWPLTQLINMPRNSWHVRNEMMMGN